MSPTPTQDNRDKIIEAAREAFVAEGYRCSIDKIAQHAGVAKQTVYNHFPNKEALFDAVSRSAVSSFLVSLGGDPEQPREAIRSFAIAYRQCALHGFCIAATRTVIGEAQRFPEMAARTYQNGPQETLRNLSEYLERAMNAGTLRKANTQLAAEILTGMLVGSERNRLLFGVTLENHDENQRVDEIVDCFMRAYQP